VVSKGESVRWHAGRDCGTSLQRDHNAATHSERAGRGLSRRRGGGRVGGPRSRRALARAECQKFNQGKSLLSCLNLAICAIFAREHMA
jgi:hypothetical protein